VTGDEGIYGKDPIVCGVMGVLDVVLVFGGYTLSTFPNALQHVVESLVHPATAHKQ
jgi:hypothetical protein